jgi:hypothetical protein
MTLGGLLMASPAWSAVLELTGPEGASVTINGRPRGFFPLDYALDLGPGKYHVECQLPGHKDYSWTVYLASEEDWQRLHVRMTRYSRKTAVGSNILFAGLGQHYLDKPAKGWLFNIAEAGGLLTALVAEAGRSNYRKDYLVLIDKYESSINSEDIAHYKLKSEEAYQDMEDMEKLRNTGLLVAGGAIVLSVLDALILFPGVEVGPGPGVIPGDSRALEDMSITSQYFNTVHAGFSLDF